MTAFASLDDLRARYPQEVVLLGADETTGLLDEGRVIAALEDSSAEVRSILQARYRPDELTRADAASRQILAIYTMDIALYRVALAFSRQTDAIHDRAAAAIKRLEAIAAGRGALTFDGDEPPPAGAGFGGAILEASEPFFPRRAGGVW